MPIDRVIDDNYRLVAWNSRYLWLYKYPKNFIRLGRPVEEMIRHNALGSRQGFNPTLSCGERTFLMQTIGRA